MLFHSASLSEPRSRPEVPPSPRRTRSSGARGPPSSQPARPASAARSGGGLPPPPRALTAQHPCRPRSSGHSSVPAGRLAKRSRDPAGTGRGDCLTRRCRRPKAGKAPEGGKNPSAPRRPFAGTPRVRGRSAGVSLRPQGKGPVGSPQRREAGGVVRPKGCRWERTAAKTL